MEVLFKERTSESRGQYSDLVYCDILNSELKVPAPASPRHHPPGPITLTIKINYTLNFADRQTGMHDLRRPMLKFNGATYVRDTDNDWFLINDWNFGTSSDFAYKFKRGQDFWDKKFMLFPPDNCDVFDYKITVNGSEETWRPNILCRFELISGPGPGAAPTDQSRNITTVVHLPLDVLSVERPFLNVVTEFRSHTKLFDIRDVETRTIWHELGHAIEEDHIQGLLKLKEGRISGEPRQNEYRCYVTPSGMAQNIMGEGEGLILENAKPWVELMSEHMLTGHYKWLVGRDTLRPPRLIAKSPV